VIARDDLTACILAGGRARRMGGAIKPLLVVDGVTIFDRLVALLAPRAAEVVVAVAGPGPLTERGVRAVIDPVADAGPLAGLAAGFAASDRPWLLAVAGDMPSVSPAVLDLVLAGGGPDVDAVVPRIAGYPEPLLAAYGRGAAAAIAERLRDGRLRTQALLDDLRVAWIEEAAVRAVDPELASFRNLNRLEQLDE